MPQRFKTIAIREELHKELMEQYRREIKTMEFVPSFSTWLSKLLADQLELRRKAKSQP